MPMGSQYVKNSFTERGGWWYWRRGTTACRIRPILECSRIWKELKSIGKTFKYLSMNPSTSVNPSLSLAAPADPSTTSLKPFLVSSLQSGGIPKRWRRVAVSSGSTSSLSLFTSSITDKPGESPSELQRSRLIRLTRLLSSHSPWCRRYHCASYEFPTAWFVGASLVQLHTFLSNW